jgi:subtilisin family serine protease
MHFASAPETSGSTTHGENVSPLFDEVFSHQPKSKRHAAIVLVRPQSEPDDAPTQSAPWAPSPAVKEWSQMKGMTLDSVLDGYQALAPSLVPQGERPLVTERRGTKALPFARVEVTSDGLAELAARPEVVAVMPDQAVHLVAPTAARRLSNGERPAVAEVTPGLEILRIPELWAAAGTRGGDIVVGVADTGVYAGHPALSGRIADFAIIDPLRRPITTSAPFDVGNHGTHVCGTIVGQADDRGTQIGVAPDARAAVTATLVGSASLGTLLESLAWLTAKGAAIINLSLGFSYFEPQFGTVLRDLERDGVLVVAAIGNEHHGNTSSPGNSRLALAVGAAAIDLPGVGIAAFSSGASLADEADPTIHIVKPDVVAPGVDVYSCVPNPNGTDVNGYMMMDGTSMATPHVAGVAAVLRAAKRTATPSDVANALRSTAQHPRGTGSAPDNRWGHGFIDPLAALAAL